jgi:hypothetical protein
MCKDLQVRTSHELHRRRPPPPPRVLLDRGPHDPDPCKAGRRSTNLLPLSLLLCVRNAKKHERKRISAGDVPEGKTLLRYDHAKREKA